MDCIPAQAGSLVLQRYGVGDGWVVWSISIRGAVKGVQALSGLALFLVVVAASTPGRAAEIEGVTLPETRSVHGAELILNGIGLRTHSVLQIHVYVAGLYLEHRSSNADEILQSPEPKALDIHFLRDVAAPTSREAWRLGFEQNCKPPCYLSVQNVERFLAAVPPIRRGDNYVLIFTPQGATVMLNGRSFADIADPLFARLILSTFIGREPATTRLKRELLGEHG